MPVETEFGRKRAIDQTSCNKDYSCLKGFCPSFVTVRGGEPRGKNDDRAGDLPHLPDISDMPKPELPTLEHPYSMVITGVGGTGVVTLGALVGMAAHLEDKGVGVIDMSGLAQKGGAVAVHLRIGKAPDTIKSIRASAAGADLVLGCDLVVAASDTVLSVVQKGVTGVIANDHESVTADFTRSPDLKMPANEMRAALTKTAGADAVGFVDTRALSNAVLGDTQSANIILLGYAWQQGRIPLSCEALEEAIRLNGVAVERNLEAFGWGRYAAHDERGLEKLLAANMSAAIPIERPQSLDELIERRVQFLTEYQDAAYAERYASRVNAIRKLEQERMPTSSALTNAVAQGLFKLMAYKDEYEVARLFTHESFRKQLDQQFGGDYEFSFHLAPPLFARVDPLTGRPQKRRYGPWMMRIMRLLAWAKKLRGTVFDPFRCGADRKLERRLLEDYEHLLKLLPDGLNHTNHGTAVELAALPETIRGFGLIKEAAAKTADARREELLAVFAMPDRGHQHAA